MLNRYFDSWIILQDLLILGILFSPFFVHSHLHFALRLIGLVIFAGGLITLLTSFFYLGHNFSPTLRPREESHLVDDGIYGLIRHPMFLSIILMTLGWSVYWSSKLSFVLSIVLAVVLYGMAKDEEKYLVLKFPAYAEYQARVPYRYIPYLF